MKSKTTILAVILLASMSLFTLGSGEFRRTARDYKVSQDEKDTRKMERSLRIIWHEMENLNNVFYARKNFPPDMQQRLAMAIYPFIHLEGQEAEYYYFQNALDYMSSFELPED